MALDWAKTADRYVCERSQSMEKRQALAIQGQIKHHIKRQHRRCRCQRRHKNGPSTEHCRKISSTTQNSLLPLSEITSFAQYASTVLAYSTAQTLNYCFSIFEVSITSPHLRMSFFILNAKSSAVEGMVSTPKSLSRLTISGSFNALEKAT